MIAGMQRPLSIACIAFLSLAVVGPPVQDASQDPPATPVEPAAEVEWLDDLTVAHERARATSSPLLVVFR